MPQSSTAFHGPSAFRRHTVMYSPWASGFCCVESRCQVHGPVLQPSRPSVLIEAWTGVHARSPCQPAGCFSYAAFPFTGPGRKTTLVGASQARKPSRTPCERTWAAKPFSAATIAEAAVSEEAEELDSAMHA